MSDIELRTAEKIKLFPRGNGNLYLEKGTSHNVTIPEDTHIRIWRIKRQC